MLRGEKTIKSIKLLSSHQRKQKKMEVKLKKKKRMALGSKLT
jgi:hypothetical protein